MIPRLALALAVLAGVTACGSKDVAAPSAESAPPAPAATPTPTVPGKRAENLAVCYAGRGDDPSGRRLFAAIRLTQGEGLAVTGTFLLGPSVAEGHLHRLTGRVSDDHLAGLIRRALTGK